MKRLIYALPLLALFAANCGGCGGTVYERLVIGHTTVNFSARLTEKFDHALKVWSEKEDKRCTAAHKAKTKEYAKCIDPALKLLRAWTGKVKGKPTGKGILPALQSAQKATRLALDAAYDYVIKNKQACKKGDSECDKKVDAWKVLIKPSLCALVEVVDRGVKIGFFKITQDKVYKLVKGFANMYCGR